MSITVKVKQLGDRFPRFIITRQGAARRRQYWTGEHWNTNKNKARLYAHRDVSETEAKGQANAYGIDPSND